MITEQEIINDLENVSKKLEILTENRRNNKSFWENINNSILNIVKSIKIDKKLYGW